MASPPATSRPITIAPTTNTTGFTEAAAVPSLGPTLGADEGETGSPEPGETPADDSVGAALGAADTDGVAVGAALGAREGASLEAAVGVAVGRVDGLAVGFWVGADVAVGLGVDVSLARTMIVPNICSEWIWQKKGNVPARSKVTWNDVPGSLNPESNRPSGAPGVPDVTVCVSPEKVQRTTSPTLTVREAGWNS